MGVNFACGLLRLLSLLGCIQRMLVGFVSLLRCQLDTLLAAGIDVFDLVAVLSGYLLQFIQAIADRLGLSSDVFFVCKWVRDKRYGAGFFAVPEVCMVVPQRGLASGGLAARRRSGLISICGRRRG